MNFLGGFWGIISIIFTLAALSRLISSKFYDKFIRGLSKKKHKGIINRTININSILSESHGMFGICAFVSSMIHILLMSTKVKFSFWGTVTFISLLLVLVTGIINKFIYRDKGGQLKRYHKTIILIYIVCLIIHIVSSR